MTIYAIDPPHRQITRPMGVPGVTYTAPTLAEAMAKPAVMHPRTGRTLRTYGDLTAPELRRAADQFQWMWERYRLQSYYTAWQSARLVLAHRYGEAL